MIGNFAFTINYDVSNGKPLFGSFQDLINNYEQVYKVQISLNSLCNISSSEVIERHQLKEEWYKVSY